MRLHKSRDILSDTSGNKPPTRHYSKCQETDIASKVGGRCTKNSGATMFQKGDIMTDKWLIEAKTTTKPLQSFRVLKEWMDKNKNESLFMGKEFSALAFSFGPSEDNYYILDEQTFLLAKELLDCKHE